MNLYILFSPIQAAAADRQDLPMETLAIHLDDEVQYRCAGFIQATIEQYTELLEDDRPQDQSDKDDSSEDEEPTKPTKGKTKSKTPTESKLFNESFDLDLTLPSSTYLESITRAGVSIHGDSLDVPSGYSCRFCEHQAWCCASGALRSFGTYIRPLHEGGY